MRRLLAMTAACVFLGAAACDSSGGGCAGGDNKPQGQSSEMSGGGGTASHGSLAETVSFQDAAKPKPDNSVAAKQSAAAAPRPAMAGPNPAAAAAAAIAAAAASPSVICTGYPGLPPDCTKSMVFDSIKAKCCPNGTVQRCEAIPGGARLYGKGCK